MSTTRAADTSLRELESALRETDAAAFLVPSRIIRRVIKEDRELTGLSFAVPHRKSYVIAAERLLQFVDRDELGVTADEPLPPRVILLTQPADEWRKASDIPRIAERYWRLLFHARVHVTLDERTAAGQLTPAVVRGRIDCIGQAAFDEIHAVLRHEHYLFAGASLTEVYIEFAAVYLELRHFAPHWLPAYFPSLADYDRIDAILAEDVDAAELLRATRFPGAADPQVESTIGDDEADAAERQLHETVADQFRPLPRRSRLLAERAARARGRGNSVGAAVWHLRAARRAAADEAGELARAALADIRTLAGRLQAALGFHETEQAAWRAALTGLLRNSVRAFWNPDRRLLYDLQKACVDHEREIYTIDLLEWMRTFGRRPVKRPLPNQREVRMSKHLRRAAGRLRATRLSGPERNRLARLLRHAAESAEHRLRDRLRPLIDRSLDDRGFAPQNVPERVARKKLIEELLDSVVQRGYLTMGHVRDAVSRSDLKLPDLSGPVELLRGDPLLRTDRRLAQRLDGVYHRGEFYLRWLQRLSSLAFGTQSGRWLTKYVAMPFGGAYVALEFVHHLLDWVMHDPPHISGGPFLLLGGLFLLGVLHVAAFRRLVVGLFRLVFRAIRMVLYDAPHWIASRPLVRKIVRSRPVLLLRRFILYPAVPTLIVWRGLPAAGVYPPPSPLVAGGVFAVLMLLLNTRVGRNLEEATAEWAGRVWYRIRARIFVALYEVIMDTFKRGLEWFERVLYAVDEWLQFKSGEARGTLAAKAVLGLVWGLVIFVARFAVNLLIEPQINPIKHFPVVTVSHKIIFPLGLPNGPLSRVIRPLVGTPQAANAIAINTVFLIPGIFGFLVWELKSNWRLYEANRHKTLRPVTVGSHGETLPRLLRPGFHSGTVPKIYARLRRAERKSALPRFRNARRKHLERLHHVEESLRQFIERELIGLLDESRGWDGLPVTVGEIDIASNSLGIELRSTGTTAGSLRLSLQEQSGWLVASVAETGWVRELSDRRRDVLLAALAGFYKRGGVDLVREQMEACFGPSPPPYDVQDRGLVLWPQCEYEREVWYELHRHTLLRPQPADHAAQCGLPAVDSSQLIFGEFDLCWSDWVRHWEADRTGEPPGPPYPDVVRLLPPGNTI